MNREESAQFQFVGRTKEDCLESLYSFYEEYVRGCARASSHAYGYATVPQYKEQILYLLMQRVRRVYTDKPMTRVGLGGHRIASLVLPAVWEMTGGDEELYRSFFEKHIVPLGVKSEDIAGFQVEQEGTLC